jgi:hypothetical protein
VAAANTITAVAVQEEEEEEEEKKHVVINCLSLLHFQYPVFPGLSTYSWSFSASIRHQTQQQQQVLSSSPQPAI